MSIATALYERSLKKHEDILRQKQWTEAQIQEHKICSICMHELIEDTTKEILDIARTMMDAGGDVSFPELVDKLRKEELLKDS